MTEALNSRELVLDLLLEVMEEGKYSHTVLNHALKKHQQLNKQERAFITRLFTGTVKIYLTLDYVINKFSSLPVDKMKPLIRNLLRLSVYQMGYMEQVPASAVCNEAVKLAKKRGFTKLSGFVNGVLRGIARGINDIQYPDRQKEPEKYLEIAYSCPGWLAAGLLHQYGYDAAEAMLAASLKEKETTIRCNGSKVSASRLKEVLIQEGVTVEDNKYLDYAFQISGYDYLEKLDSFSSGLFAIQDVSSMLVCETAGIRQGDYVIDVCAAPGGKALHAAETAGEVSARDLTEYKIDRIKDNIGRLGLQNVTVKVWDALQPDEASVRKADVVIADLPCSGLGVIGKKPEIKYRLSPKLLDELVELQRGILSVVQNYVKENGVLIFSTCTVNQAENTGNRDWFLRNYDFKAEELDSRLPEQLLSDTTKEGYLQLLQGIHGTDGFFLSKFRRQSSI